jgi:hypothetical protein
MLPPDNLKNLVIHQSLEESFENEYLFSNELRKGLTRLRNNSESDSSNSPKVIPERNERSQNYKLNLSKTNYSNENKLGKFGVSNEKRA